MRFPSEISALIKGLKKKMILVSLQAIERSYSKHLPIVAEDTIQTVLGVTVNVSLKNIWFL